MKRTYLILVAACLSFSSFSQDRKLPEVAASKLATFTIPAGTSKIAATSLPDKVQLASKTSSSLFSVFTKSNASGEYYKLGNFTLRVRGIEKAVSEDYLLKISKERFTEEGEGSYESRQYEVINGYKVLTINIKADANYGFMLVYVQNPSNANFLMMNVLYPMTEKANSIPNIRSFIRTAKFK